MPLPWYLYAPAPEGAPFETGSGEGLLIFDIDHGFNLVRRIGGWSLQTGTRGRTGCRGPHSRSYSTTGQGMGRFVLETDMVIWETKLPAGCDRSSVLPDGSRVFESGKPFGKSLRIEVQMRGAKVIGVSTEFGLGRKK